MRGQVLSFYMITNYFAAGCGQFLLPLADPSEFHLFSVASIIFSLALVPVLLSRAQAPMPASSHWMKMTALYRISPLGFIGVFCAGLVNAAFHGMGAVFGHEIGLSTQQISFFMASAIFGGLVLQWPMGTAVGSYRSTLGVDWCLADYVHRLPVHHVVCRRRRYGGFVCGGWCLRERVVYRLLTGGSTHQRLCRARPAGAGGKRSAHYLRNWRKRGAPS